MTDKTIDISLSGAVWHDALDPSATEMESALGLDRFFVRSAKRGRWGRTFFYEGVPLDVAEDLAQHLRDRAETLWGSTEPSERGALRAEVKAVEKIREQIREATQ